MCDGAGQACSTVARRDDSNDVIATGTSLTTSAAGKDKKIMKAIQALGDRFGRFRKRLVFVGFVHVIYPFTSFVMLPLGLQIATNFQLF